MQFELFVSLRYLLARRKQAFISVISLISVLGVAIGVASLIVVLGVMNGFSENLRDKILGINSHLILGSVKPNIEGYDLLLTATGNQELNIITAMYAKKLGISRTIALVQRRGYVNMAHELGIDVVVSLNNALVNSILKIIRHISKLALLQKVLNWFKRR